MSLPRTAFPSCTIAKSRYSRSGRTEAADGGWTTGSAPRAETIKARTTQSSDATLQRIKKVLFVEFTDRLARRVEIGQPHFGIFPRQDDAVRAGFQGGGGCGIGVVRCGLARVFAGGDADVDAGQDAAFAPDSVERAFRFSRHVI